MKQKYGGGNKSPVPIRRLSSLPYYLLVYIMVFSVTISLGSSEIIGLGDDFTLTNADLLSVGS